MLYVLHAYDYTDPEAIERRLAARQDHLDGARQLKSNGHFVMGGALLDSEGKMIGSMMVVDFENDTDVNHWLSNDPYVTGKVWEKMDIKPFRQAAI